MNKKIKKAIEKNIVNPALEKDIKPQVAVVTEAFYESQKEHSTDTDSFFNIPIVNIELRDGRTNKKRSYYNVPIIGAALSSNIDGRKVQKGDRVMVLFYRGRDKEPYVLGRIYTEDREMEDEMRTEGGALKSNANGYF